MLTGMKERYQQTNDESIRPDEVTYGIVLHALAQAGMAREADSILTLLKMTTMPLLTNLDLMNKVSYRSRW